jgi:hypothetical protein
MAYTRRKERKRKKVSQCPGTRPTVYVCMVMVYVGTFSIFLNAHGRKGRYRKTHWEDKEM